VAIELEMRPLFGHEVAQSSSSDSSGMRRGDGGGGGRLGGGGEVTLGGVDGEAWEGEGEGDVFCHHGGEGAEQAEERPCEDLRGGGRRRRRRRRRGGKEIGEMLIIAVLRPL